MAQKRSMLRFISLSNLFSYFSLAAALAAFHFALLKLFHLAAALLALSAFFDNFDGAFAALFQRNEEEKEFGRELDSLIDCIAFGIVPIACLRVLSYPHSTILRIAFAAASFLFVLAAVTRLGNFNIVSRRGRKGFEGLPTTESVLVLTTVLIFPFPREYLWTILIVLAAFMLLPIRIRNPEGAFRILLTFWLVSVVGVHFLMHFVPIWSQ